MAIKDINVFEMNNDISVNGILVENKDIYICRKGIRRDHEINLLLISEDDKLHYTVVKSLSRLLTSMNTKHKCKQYFRNNCLQGFMQEQVRDQHRVYCEDNETVRVEMPRKGSTVEFYDGQNQFKVPFIMHTDFESILEPIQGPNPDPKESYTSEVTKHSPSGWCVYSKFAYGPSGPGTPSGSYGEVKNPLNLYRGKDCLEKFCDYIREKLIGCTTCFLKNPWTL